MDKQIVEQIKALITEWDKMLNDEDYLEALMEMAARAETAREAREEEMANDDHR